MHAPGFRVFVGSLNPVIAVAAAMLVAFFSTASAQETLTREENTNRFGSDYRAFDLQQANPELCRRACAEDSRCRAYTYVQPGVQGQTARCYLKDPAPATNADACCISGVKQSQSAQSVAPRTGGFVFRGTTATRSTGATRFELTRVYPTGASLFYWQGDIKTDIDRRAFPGASDFLFHWDTLNMRGEAGAALWQASTKPFPPFAGDGPSVWNPDGLVASGVVAKDRHFTFNIPGAIEEAKRQSRRPTLVFGDGALCEHAGCDGFRFVACGATDGSGELISRPEIRGHRIDYCKHWGRECGEPAATLYCQEKGYERAVRWAIEPDVGAGAEDQDRFTFYVRIVPLQSIANPTVVGQPSNTIPVLYNHPEIPPDFRFFTEEKTRTPGPAIELTALRYQAYRYISKWPSGCKEPSGKTRQPPAIVKAITKAWSYVDEAYDKAQDLVVNTFDTLTFGAIPKGVWELGLDAAMMYAGVPPDIPNLQEMMQKGPDYLAAEVARVAVEQVPAGSVVPGTGDLVTDVLLGASEGVVREELEDQMRHKIENETRQAILNGAAEFEKLIKKEYKYCRGKSLQPTYFVTVRNGSGGDIPNFTVETTDTERVFETKTVSVMLRAGQTMTIPLAPEQNIRPLPDRWQFESENINDEIRNWWDNFYLKRQTKIIVRATGDHVCRDPLGPQGEVCNDEMKTLFISPQAQLLNASHTLVQ